MKPLLFQPAPAFRAPPHSPVHTELVREVGRIERLRPRVEDMADDLAAGFLPRGEAELISEFAFPLPLMVIVELLGMPVADRDQFQRWARMTVPRGPDSLPDQHAALRADPSLLPAAIEEMVRYDGPIELGISRFTTEEITVGDVTIPGGGEVVLLAIGSADRDPDRFADPDLLQMRRAGTGHLGFGYGIHYCLGAPLARMEAVIALRLLFDRRADLSLAVDPDQIAWQINPHLRGPAALPVRFTPYLDAR